MAIGAAGIVEIGEAFLERYEVLEKVGEGGFGDVYRARQRTTGQTVAIKVLRIPEGQSKERVERLVARFAREARLCAKLSHPNIVRLVDAGTTEDERVYSVFEFVPGKTLAAVLADEQRLPPVEARHLMAQILDALACAHTQGVVHRDLKPANIMVVPTGARRNAIVLDFGISSFTDEARRDEIRITRSHELLGTPVYAAPEQLRGQPPLPRSDLYTWGLIFLECLTGQAPIRGDRLADVVYQQLSPEPIFIPAPIAAHPLGLTLRRATEKVPEMRDVTAEGLLRELEMYDVSDLRLDGNRSFMRPSERTGTTATMREIHGVRSTNADAAGAVDVLPLVHRPSVGERRQVTVVSCTLSMVRDASGGAEFDELDPLLEAEQDVCAAIARRFGGHVGGALNETVLFFFGYPAAGEDDARRAAIAALAMETEVRRRSATSAKGNAAHGEIRIGIHTGMIVTRDLGTPAGPMHNRLGGATPMMASRLSTLAQPGEILVSGDTHRLLRSHFLFEGRAAIASGGAPVDVYRLLESSTVQGAPDIPLVGRQRELDALCEHWASACSGAGQAALITGEPGIGKSRLARALRERIGAEPHTYLEGRCAPDATNSPLYPIIDMLDRLLDPSREHSAEVKAERLASLLSRQGFELAEAMPLFTSLLSLPLHAPYAPLTLSPQKQRELTHNAVLALVFEMSEHAPMLLVVEDLHWADPSTLELCAALVSDVSSSRILTLCTGRPEFSPTWSPSAVLFLQIGHLAPSDIARMATAVSGGRSLPPGLIEQIAARTDGVPLFVEELVQMMLESGALVEREGHLVLAGALDALRIPSTLRDFLAARLDRLGRAKETTRVAAAIGREFSFELLRAVLSVDESKLREDLDKLVAAGLVHRKRRPKSAAYIFKHALVQDTAYDTMPKARRRDIHERIARTLEREFPGVAEEHPAVLARHMEEAGLTNEAVAYLLQGGQRALGRGANTEAITLLEHGITLLRALPESLERFKRELDLRAILSGALLPVRGYCAPEVMANLAKAHELCDRLGDPLRLFPVLYSLWAANITTSHRALSEAYAAQLFDLAREHPDRVREITAYYAVGVTHFYRGRFENARAALSHALSLYDPELHPLLVRVFGDDHGLASLTYLAWLEVFTGQADKARGSVDALFALAERFQNPLALTMASVCALTIDHDLRNVERTMALSERTNQIAMDQGFYFWRSYALCGRGWARAIRGEHDGGIAEIRDGLSFFYRAQQKLPLTYLNAYLVEACMFAGRIDEALRVVEATLADSATNVDSFNEPELLRLKGDLIVAHSGRTDAALAWYERAIMVAREYGAVYYELRAATSLARALSTLGNTERAHACLAEVTAKMREGHHVPVYVEAAQLLAELAGRV